jgi:hypothetical protein
MTDSCEHDNRLKSFHEMRVFAGLNEEILVFKADFASLIYIRS